MMFVVCGMHYQMLMTCFRLSRCCCTNCIKSCMRACCELQNLSLCSFKSCIEQMTQSAIFGRGMMEIITPPELLLGCRGSRDDA